MAGQRRAQPGAHLAGENVEPQALGFANFVLVLCPRHRNTAAPAKADLLATFAMDVVTRPVK
jgi:hypothetical protein